MKLILCNDDGQIIDTSDEFTREEWNQLTQVGAFALLDTINPDAS